MAGRDAEAEALFIGDAAARLVGVMARVAGWRPDELWAATPADVAAVLGGWGGDAAAAAVGFDRAALAAMMEQCPDD
ncbi:MAG: phage tail assembly chaperone [Sphingopyxis sp.]|uniref:phage tail assembly chaperone n=1 Tax=Sphingopyxis sp. TaxID=1908224 RepID=UPI002ABC6731|nr:phage tail assembly chaperone [Sphingopyxis sp.]MDZ3830338.1 phage tail assembly chaperone [Sphingopyxis sp.]